MSGYPSRIGVARLTQSLNQAIAVIDASEGEKPMALTQWRDRAAARLQLQQAMVELSEAVLRQISALGGVAP